MQLNVENVIDFCILILYPDTLINSNVSYSGFFEGSLSSSTLTIMSSVNKDILTSFLTCMPFISLSFLIATSKISNKILIEVLKVDIPNLFVVLEESIQYFTIKNNVLVCHVIDALYQNEEILSTPRVLRIFIKE